MAFPCGHIDGLQLEDSSVKFITPKHQQKFQNSEPKVWPLLEGAACSLPLGAREIRTGR